jgi:hypothetical protein
MGIVGFALRYRHTFYVLALMMLFLGGTAILATPKDIFPNINIPVVTVIWQYTGLTPEEMEQRITTYSEYAISSSDERRLDARWQQQPDIIGGRDDLADRQVYVDIWLEENFLNRNAGQSLAFDVTDVVDERS